MPAMKPLVLSLQSHVAAGCVGNRAAVFALERLGCGVAAVHTLQFSNHPGHGRFAGRVFPPEEVASLLEATLDHLGADQVSALLSGYLGDPGNVEAALAAAARIRAAGRGGFWLCDPVMGDDGAVYVRPGLVEGFRERVVGQAEVLVPNVFELGLLTGAPVADTAGALAAARRLLTGRTRLVVTTSLPCPTREEIGLLAVDAEGAWMMVTPMIAFAEPPHGSGDLFAALLCERLLHGDAPAAAMVRAGNAVFAALEVTAAAGADELALAAAQELLAEPPRRYAAVRLP